MDGQQKTYKKYAKEDRPSQFKRQPVKGMQTSSSPKVLARKLLVVEAVGVVNQSNIVRTLLPINWFKMKFPGINPIPNSMISS